MKKVDELNLILPILMEHKVWIRGQYKDGETFGGRIEGFGPNSFLPICDYQIVIQKHPVRNADKVIDWDSIHIQDKVGNLTHISNWLKQLG